MVNRLRHRITVEENTPVRNTYGELIDAWTTVETVYGAVRPYDGTTLMRAAAGSSLKGAEITMRYRTDLGTADTRVLPRYRLRYQNRLFSIDGVRDLDESHKFIVLDVEEMD